MRKTIVLKVYGRVDPKLEDRRVAKGGRVIRRPFEAASSIDVTPKDAFVIDGTLLIQKRVKL